MPVYTDPLAVTATSAAPTVPVQQGKQIGGNHYQGLTIHPDRFATMNRWDACAFSILKYLTRWRQKDGVKDLQKAAHFVERRTAFETENLITHDAAGAIPISTYLRANKIASPDTRAFILLEQWVTFHPTAAMAFDLKTEIDMMIADAAEMEMKS